MPAHARHDEVADDDGRTERGNSLERFFAVGGSVRGESPSTDELSESDAGARLVLDDQDSLGGGYGHYFLGPITLEGTDGA